MAARLSLRTVSRDGRPVTRTAQALESPGRCGTQQGRFRPFQALSGFRPTPGLTSSIWSTDRARALQKLNGHGHENIEEVKIRMVYRRLKLSDTWHFCRNCTSWPTANYV